MIRNRLIAVLFAASISAGVLAQSAVRPVPLKSGIEFTGAEVRALQNDEFANPGMLWVTRGAAVWEQAAGGENRSCAGCHGDAAKSMRGAAMRYPQIDKADCASTPAEIDAANSTAIRRFRIIPRQ